MAHKMVEVYDISKRRACEIFTISLGCFWYRSKRKPDDEIIDILLKFARENPRWGFGLMFGWLRYEDYKWNHKRVYRVYKELCLNLRIKAKRRFKNRNPIPLDDAEASNDYWSLDFTSDSATDGRKFRTLNIIDNFNREVLAIEIDLSLPVSLVIHCLDQVAVERHYPRKLRSDNGPEFIAHALKAWAERCGIDHRHIEPGKPTQNAYIERFNRTFREDVLSMNAFENLDEVRDVSTRWQYDYNHHRPHRALGRVPPVKYRERYEEVQALKQTETN